MEKKTTSADFDVAAERERLLNAFKRMVKERKEDERTAETRILNRPGIQEELKKTLQADTAVQNFPTSV